MKKLYRWLDWLFTSKLACRIDYPNPVRRWLGFRWYCLSGRIGAFFHIRHCPTCDGQYSND